MLRPKESPSCTSCPLYENGIIVRDRDPLVETPLVLVGEMPGRDEVKQGACFVGLSGKLLDSLLKALEVKPLPYITNAIRCGLPYGAKPSTKDMKLASQCCRELTDATLRTIEPKVVVAVGSTSLKHLLGVDGIEKYRGCCWEATDDNPWIATCTVHPAGLLRKDEKRIWIELLRDDLAKAAALAAGREQLWEPLVGNAADVNELLQLFRTALSRKSLVVDVETTGLDALTCSLRTIGVGVEGRAFSIPWPAYFPRFWNTADWRNVWGWLKRLFGDPSMRLIFSNKIYDVSVLRQKRYFGDRLRAECHDILLKHHAVYPKLPHDLQSMSSQFLATPPWKCEFHEGFGEWGDDADKTDAEKASALFWYNACDVAATEAVDARVTPLLTACGVEKVYESDRRMVDVSIDWYRRGILIDMNEVRRLAKEYRSGDPDNPGILDKLENLVQGYAREAGVEKFNPASQPQLSDLLYKRLGLPATTLTETGKLSTAKEQLYKIFHQHPIIPALMKLRKEAHLYATYLVGLERKLHADGRLHSVGNITATPSGRFGFSPAVQNWPKGKKPGEINMLRMMRATPGTLYVGCDYSALELRVYALLAGEKRLIDLFNDGADVHSIHAEAFFGDAFRAADAAGRKALRDRGKPVTFGKNYGAGAETLFEQILPDRLDENPKDVLREVQHMSDVFDGMYPMLAAAGDYYLRFAEQNRNLRTLLTRRLRKFPMGGATVTVAKNHPVQGTAGDVANYGTLRWIDELRNDGAYWTTVWPTLQIHDSLAAEVACDSEERLLNEARRLQRTLYTELTHTSEISGTTNTMKFPVEVFIGSTAGGWDDKESKARWLSLLGE